MAFGDGLFAAYNSADGSIIGSYSNLYQLKQDMSYTRGPHNLKWGIELRANRGRRAENRDRCATAIRTADHCAVA